VTLLNPAGVWWLLLVPALVAVYLLRTRPQDQRVSSLRLWRDLPQVERPRAQFRRPPRSLLLLLQLLLLLAGGLALARPALTGPAPRRLLILLDASGSMGARDGAATRFDAARDAARRLIAPLAGADVVTLVRVGAEATVACAACPPATAAGALDNLRAGVARANWPAAFAVAQGEDQGPDAQRVEGVVLSDGAFDPLVVGAFPGRLHFMPIGGPVDNRGVVDLSARRPPNGSERYAAYARIVNNGAAAATLEVAALADAGPLPARQITIPPGGQADEIWTLPVGTAQFAVRLTPPDALPADDSATLILPTTGRRAARITAAQPDLYQRALAAIPGVAVITGTAAADINVIEGAPPDPLPPGGALLINPPAAWLPGADTATDVRAAAIQATHPALDGLDLGALLVSKARRVTPPAWLEPIVDSDAGPLLLAGSRDGRRVAVLTFDPRQSNLPKLTAFPVLMANLVAWLDPLAGAQALRPGESIALPPDATVRAPGGPAAPVGATGLFAGADAPGVYQVTRPGAAPLAFAVNMTDAAESDLRPRPHPELERDLTADTGATGAQEAWRPLVALALALLGAEWLIFYGRRAPA
jgi:Ca-activated chloride channel homolog